MPKIKLNPPQILVASFAITIILGSILLTTPWAIADGTGDWLTSLFTATSAVCVTGLVVVDTGTHWTIFGQVIIMILIQIGGLGVMSFATFFAIVLGKRINLKQRLIMQQALNQPSIDGIVRIFKYLLMASFIAEVIGALILAINWTPDLGIKKALWYGLFHSISAFNNAGFDIFGNFSSLTYYTTDFITNMVISTLFIFGGLGFIVLYEIYNYRANHRISLHTKVVLITTGILIVFGTIMILFSEYNHALQGLSLGEKLMTAYFQAVTPRTAGFNTIDLNSMLLSSQLIIIALMFIGGSPGSTAGGIKTSTFSLLLVAISSILRGKNDAEIFDRRIDASEVARALAIALLGLLVIFVITILVSMTHQADFKMVLFEVVSALGTTGLSLGLTTELNDFGQILIIITMFLGRVGPITIGYALAYNNKKPHVRYPKGKIMIG